MPLGDVLGRLLGGDEEPANDGRGEQRGEPSHVCRSCGEEYHSEFDVAVDECRECGGVKVEPA